MQKHLINSTPFHDKTYKLGTEEIFFSLIKGINTTQPTLSLMVKNREHPSCLYIEIKTLNKQPHVIVEKVHEPWKQKSGKPKHKISIFPLNKTLTRD